MSAEETSSHAARFLINAMPAHHRRVGRWTDREIIAAGVVQCLRDLQRAERSATADPNLFVHVVVFENSLRP